MTEQSTLLLVRLDSDRLWTPNVGQLWTQTPKYPRPYISVNDAS